MAIREPIYDAAVVGAGIVGLAAANALAGAGYRTALVERTPAVRRRGELGFDLRTVALAPRSVELLRALGGIDDAELAPIEAMRVWEYDGSGSLRFVGDGPLAYVAENSALTMRLWKTAEARVDIFPQSSVTGLAHTRDAVVLAGPDLAARLVVAADGSDSVVRQLTETPVRYEPSYRLGFQHAIVTIARTARPHVNVAYQRFGRTGPVALLPLAASGGPGNTVAVIWSTSAMENLRLQPLDDCGFMAALGVEVEGVLGDFVAVDRRLSFPVRQGLSADFNPTPRTLIIGDAARTLHPLAGQGVNVGLEDVRALAATASRTDLGTAGTWRGFARERRMRSKLLMAAMRGLLAAYCGPRATNPWMRLARNTGVRFIDAASPIKAQLVREAMGLGPLAIQRERLADPGVSRRLDSSKAPSEIA